MGQDAVIALDNAVTYDAPAARRESAGSGPSFSDVMSSLNPLQYLPVIGTIYRAVTGDTIPKPLREAGSLVVSGLMGGPVGLATGLATLAFEKVTGLDFEDIEQSVLGSLHLGAAAPTDKIAAEGPAKLPQAADQPDASAHAGAWTAAQLAAYGVVTLKDGTLRHGALTGADVLNALQLAGGFSGPAMA